MNRYSVRTRDIHELVLGSRICQNECGTKPYPRSMQSDIDVWYL